MWKPKLKARPHDATLLHETRDSAPWSTAPRCLRVASVSNNVGLRELGAHRQLLSRCRWGRVLEQCSTEQSCIVWIDLKRLEGFKWRAPGTAPPVAFWGNCKSGVLRRSLRLGLPAPSSPLWACKNFHSSLASLRQFYLKREKYFH